ncbi:hypothetical protein RSAG8_03801, partial [Rhizoctonia solani AG-8 WAC10335]
MGLLGAPENPMALLTLAERTQCHITLLSAFQQIGFLLRRFPPLYMHLVDKYT